MAGVATLLLAAAAIAGCAATPRTVTITIHYSEFDPTEIRVPRGVPITFVLVNEDPIDHEGSSATRRFTRRIGPTHASHGDVLTEVTVPALQTARTTITFEEAGTSRTSATCRHEAYGMVGALMVEVDRDSYTPAVHPNPPRLITVVIAVALVLVACRRRSFRWTS